MRYDDSVQISEMNLSRTLNFYIRLEINSCFAKPHFTMVVSMVTWWLRTLISCLYLSNFCSWLTYFHLKTEDYLLRLLFFTSSHAAYHILRLRLRPQTTNIFSAFIQGLLLSMKKIGVWKCYYKLIWQSFRSLVKTWNCYFQHM